MLDGTGSGPDHPDPADTDGHDHTAATAVWSATGPVRYFPYGIDLSGVTRPNSTPSHPNSMPTRPDPRLENAIEELDRYLPRCNNPASFTHLCTQNEEKVWTALIEISNVRRKR